MKKFAPLLLLALCTGCASTTGPFVQNDIRIVPPVTDEGYDSATGTLKLNIFADGGARYVTIKDAEGNRFEVYIDRRLDSTTRGAIYLNAYPDKTNSVRVINEREFRRKIGALERHYRKE